MNFYRLECDSSQIGCMLDTKTRNNNVRHLNYYRYSRIMIDVFNNSLKTSNSILKTISTMQNTVPELHPLYREHTACVSTIWDAVFDLFRPSNINIGRTECAYFFMDEASCMYYREYNGMANAHLCKVEIINEYDRFIGDMKWLDDIDEKNAIAKDIKENAIKYWAGKMTKTPIKEVLFQGQYKLYDYK